MATETSIGKLFIAGILRVADDGAIFRLGAFSYLRDRRRKLAAGFQLPEEKTYSLGERLAITPNPALVLVVALVLSSLYTGWPRQRSRGVEPSWYSSWP